MEDISFSMKCCGLEIIIFICCVTNVESGFFFGSSLLKWESARIDCETRNMRLVCVKNLTMYDAVKSYIQNELNSLSEDVWIGLRTYSTSPPIVYKHMDNEPADFFRWSPHGEPDNQDSSLCIRLFKHSLTYGTKDCLEKFHYICEDVPVNGHWSEWTTWSACSVTSGDGVQSRFRFCDSPPPSNGGVDCLGVNTEDKFCNIVIPIDGVWSLWSEWSNCTLETGNQCGVGNRTRSRSCDCPPPSGGGKDCAGDPKESEECDNIVCSSDEYVTCIYFKEVTPITLGEKIENITKTLAVNKTTLSSEVRRKTCAEDPRTSSRYMGLVAIVFLGIFFGLLLLLDFSTLLRWTFEKCKAK